MWYPVSGATNHVTGNSSDIQHQDSTPATSGVQIANGNEIPVLNSGSSEYTVGQSIVVLREILHVLYVRRNLMSIKRLRDDNCVFVKFDSSSVSVKDRRTNELLVSDDMADGLYKLEIGDKPLSSINLGVKVPTSIWHARLGHCNGKLMKDLIQEFKLPASSKYMDCCQKLIGILIRQVLIQMQICCH